MFCFIHTQRVIDKSEQEVVVTEWPDKLKQELESCRVKKASQDLTTFDKSPTGIAVKNIQTLRDRYVAAGFDNKKSEPALRDLVMAMQEAVTQEIFKSYKLTSFLDSSTHNLLAILVQNLQPGIDFSPQTLK
jgi:hypothetical protein